MTVFDNVAFPLRQTTKLSKEEIEKRVMKRIEDLELEEAVGISSLQSFQAVCRNVWPLRAPSSPTPR